MGCIRTLSFVVLLIYFFGAVSSLKNDRGPPNFVRRNRRVTLNEYLVPPPLPQRPPAPVRTGRLTNPRPTEPPGYFSKLMGWLNPFAAFPSAPQSEPPFPAPPKSHPPHSPIGPPLSPPFHPQPGPPPLIYSAPPPPSFERHQPPPSSGNSRGGYSPPNRGKNCNPCNKAPWIPIQNSGFHQDEHSFLPPAPSGQSHSSGGGDYLPPPPPPPNQDAYDVHHAASQEVRAPDFSHVHVAQNGQGPVVGPLPNPHLYPGPMPPLYKAEPFDRPPQHFHEGNVGYLEPPALPVLPLQPVETNQHSGGTFGQQYGSPDVRQNEFGRVDGHDNRDLASSGTQVNQGHISAIPQNQSAEGSRGAVDHSGSFNGPVSNNKASASGESASHAYANPSPTKQAFGDTVYQTGQSLPSPSVSYGSSNPNDETFVESLNGETSVESNKQEFHESFHSHVGFDNIVDHLIQKPSGSFGSSGFGNTGPANGNDQSHRHSNEPSSGTPSKDSQIIVQASVERATSSSIENPIHYEESPLLDLTKHEDGRTKEDTQWLFSTANTFIDAEESSSDLRKATETYNSGTNIVSLLNGQLDSTRPTESYVSSEQLQDVDGTLETPIDSSFSKVPNDSQQEISYIPSSAQPGFSWPTLLSSTSQPNGEESLIKTLAKLYDESGKAGGNASGGANYGAQKEVEVEDLNRTVQRQQGVKRNKQVQVIIPYTSEYTPIPFHQSHNDWSVKSNVERTQPRKVPYPIETNRDNYISEESRNQIRVASRTELQRNFSSLSNTEVRSTTPLSPTAAHDVKNTSAKDNSIDVHRLQKNIDNWTIQEYSRATTSSTVLPSSSHPYLLPSKKIPDEYLTTTESGDHTNDSNDHNENVKTYSLAGFSFNDLEHEGSASNRVEGARVQVIRIDDSKTAAAPTKNSSESSTDEESSWKGFTVSISPLNKERVYVVTPQSAPVPTTKSSPEREKKGKEISETSKHSRKITVETKKSKNKLNEFEAIERAYQVLPQAVNNLAVASTGKEAIPLWGIMEHEEFASLNLENGDDNDDDAVEGPILYAGHSKVSHSSR